MVPEIRDLSYTWNKIDNYYKGHKIGYIIGKYGIDIFAPLGILKGAKRIQSLKRANTMCTIEACAASQIKQAKVLEESGKRALFREVLIANAVKDGKILVRNFNTKIHIMQSKHAWDKLIKISGNIEEDFKKVIYLLEENKIFLEKHRIEPTKNFKSFIRYEHQMKINEYNVKIVFNKNLETGEVFLNDAWVITQ